MSPPRVSHTHQSCMAIREVLALVGNKWSVLIVGTLATPKRFSELRRSVDGISQRMLTLTLKGLERDGLVIRTVTPTKPPRVDYALTALGRTLLGPVKGLAEWALDNRATLEASRQRYDARQARSAARSA